MVVNRLPLSSNLRRCCRAKSRRRGRWNRSRRRPWRHARSPCGARAAAVLRRVLARRRSQCLRGHRPVAAATTKAVNQTAGGVPLYGGKPIEASTSPRPAATPRHRERVADVPGGVPEGRGGQSTTTTRRCHLARGPHALVGRQAGRRPGHLQRQPPRRLKGVLQSIYVVKRGVSPRVVKAPFIGDKGITWVSGSTLRFALNLRDTWVYFTPCPSSPAGAQHKTDQRRRKVTVSGRNLPGARQRHQKGDPETSRAAARGTPSTWPTTAPVSHWASGKKAYYSTYALTVAPAPRPSTTSRRRRPVAAHRGDRQAGGQAERGRRAGAGRHSSVQFTGTVGPAYRPAARCGCRPRRAASGPTRPAASRTSQGAFTITWKGRAVSLRCGARAPATTKLAAGSAPLWPIQRRRADLTAPPAPSGVELMALEGEESRRRLVTGDLTFAM